MHYGADHIAHLRTLQAMNAKNVEIADENADLRNSISERLRGERARLQLTVASLCKLAGGFSARSIYDWESGRGSPKAEFLAVAGSLGIDVPYVLTGSRSISTEDEASSPSSGFHITPKTRKLTGPSPAPIAQEDTLYIPLLSATGSMGPGTEALAADVVMGDVPVSLTWVQMNLPRSRPEALRLVHAYGDSMRGTLESGDFALVDTDIHSVDIDGVYVLEAHERLFIKRVRQRMDGAYEISSDNPAIKQIDILNGGHEVRICGMVVYGWNGRRF